MKGVLWVGSLKYSILLTWGTVNSSMPPGFNILWHSLSMFVSDPRTPLFPQQAWFAIVRAESSTWNRRLSMNRKQWNTLVDEFHKSGLSKRAFADKHSLVYHQLLYYITQESSQQSKTAVNDLVPVKVKTPTKPPSNDVLGVIEFTNGSRLEICNPELLHHIAPLLLG